MYRALLVATLHLDLKEYRHLRSTRLELARVNGRELSVRHYPSTCFSILCSPPFLREPDLFVS